MNNKEGSNHVIDMIFVVALLFLFVMSALMLIALGSSIYRQSVNTMQENTESRTAYAYITEKLRQYDAEGSIRADKFHGQNALVISSRVDGTEYLTYLYEYEGSLMELIARADSGDIPARQGQKIMDISSFDVKPMGDGIFKMNVELTDGRVITFITTRKSADEDDGV